MTAKPMPIYVELSFMESLSRLPEATQRKARLMLKKLESEPTAHGLNFEKINHAHDPQLRSVRVDLSYRAILHQSKNNDACILLWVDNHDEAYDWAARRRLVVHPQSGSIQILDIAAGQVPAPEPDIPSTPATPEDPRPALFEPFSDADLIQLGANEETLALIRSITDEQALQRLERRFPPELNEGLFMLACGENYDSVIEELGISKGREFDTGDTKAALELDSNLRNFALITDDAQMEAMLNEPLARWRVFLHPSQRKLVRANFNGPARVLGGAGTGKTVVAMHRARHLATQCRQGERILFTTFTKSLISDIKNNLKKICSFDELHHIEVVHLDAWCHEFLQSKGYAHKVVYGDPAREGKSNALSPLWQNALGSLAGGDFTPEFLRCEWERVIQYHDIESFADYARTPRVGRRGRLGRTERKMIWPVFEEYRTLLNEHQLWEPADMFRAARSLLDADHDGAGFKHIVVDEIQDFHPQAFRMLRAMIPTGSQPPNDLFLVGDGHQNIYGHHVILGRLGIDIRGRGRRLKLNYRTPEETRRWAVAILENLEISDLDGGVDAYGGYHSCLSGPEPDIVKCRTFEDEIRRIAEWYQLLRRNHPNHGACVAVRSNQDRERYAKALADAGCQIHEITGDIADHEETVSLRVATMHRIKGLEFDHVCLAGGKIQEVGQLPLEEQALERCLLHVAATRTKNSLLVIER